MHSGLVRPIIKLFKTTKKYNFINNSPKYYLYFYVFVHLESGVPFLILISLLHCLVCRNSFEIFLDHKGVQRDY